ncbi:hypothetical protein L665_03350 [Ralstonia solanacearum SD54]|nr:hypothetical protein L665_03350 [Ralstonia solanacearum SD54]
MIFRLQFAATQHPLQPRPLARRAAKAVDRAAHTPRPL